MNGCDFFKCHPNYTVVKIILKVSKYIKTLKLLTVLLASSLVHVTTILNFAHPQQKFLLTSMQL